MKIFFLSGMYPTPTTPHGGIFISKRIKYLLNEVDLDLYVLAIKDSGLLKIIKKLLKISPNPNNKLGQKIYIEEIDRSYKVILVNEGIIDKLISKIFNRNSIERKAEKKILNVVSELNVDLLHAHWSYPHGVVAQRVARKLGKPSLITAHGSDINFLLKEPKLTKTIIQTLNNASKVEFVSNALLQTAREYGFGNKYQVVPNGIEPLHRVHKEPKNERKYKVIGFVGNLINVKGADLLPDIIASVYKKTNIDVRFVIIGDGNLMSQLSNVLSSKDVVFTGRVSHNRVLEEMSQLDLLILPSRSEGWPCVVLEAHSLGIPVIGSDRGGIPEAIGNPMLIVDFNEEFIESFSSKIVDLLKNNLRINSEVLIERSKEYYWSKLVKETCESYKTEIGVKHE